MPGIMTAKNADDSADNYRIAGMFGGDKVWRIALSKVIGEKKFGECLQQRCAAYYYVIITCRVHVRDCVCNHEAGMRMSSFVLDSMIRAGVSHVQSHLGAS